MTASNFLENALKDKTLRNVNYTVTTVFVALHTGAPGDAGAANEVAGGSYARQSSTWDAAVTDTATGNTAGVSFSGMPAVPAPGVLAWSLWDTVSAGNCLLWGWLTNVSELPKPFVLVDTATDLFLAPSHGYANGDTVTLSSEIGATTIPTGVSADTLYFIVSTLTNSFQLSLTSGGAAIAIAATGSGMVQRVVGKTVNAGDTLTFNAGQAKVVAY
jgi:hypothetical protein